MKIIAKALMIAGALILTLVSFIAYVITENIDIARLFTGIGVVMALTGSLLDDLAKDYPEQ